MKRVIKGLQILIKYYDNDGAYQIGSEHDQMYAYATDHRLSTIDIEEMIKLGWHQEHEDRNYGEDFTVSDYRDNEPWTFYT